MASTVHNQAMKLAQSVHSVDHKLKRMYFEEQLWCEYNNSNANDEFKLIIEWYEDIAEYEMQM